MSIHKIDIKYTTVITSPMPTVLLLLQLLLWNCCTILALPIESDNGWILWSWYSNYNINLPHRKQSFASGTNAFLVAKNGAQKIIPLSWIKSSQGNIIWCLRCQNSHINLPIMMVLFASGTTKSLVAKIRIKYLATSCLVYKIWNNGQIFMFKVLKQLD